jgi:acetyl-CoA carboxylase beta subunit
MFLKLIFLAFLLALSTLYQSNSLVKAGPALGGVTASYCLTTYGVLSAACAGVCFGTGTVTGGLAGNKIYFSNSNILSNIMLSCLLCQLGHVTPLARRKRMLLW